MSEAVVRRWLKVADATAMTTRETLQRALSYGRTVRDLTRSEIVAFQSPASQESLEDGLAVLSRETNMILNPNKHFMQIAAGEDILSARGNVCVLVTEAGRGGSLAEVITRRRLPGHPVSATWMGTLWELDLDTGDPYALALEMALGRERKKGLLANPHVHTVCVLGGTPTAAQTANALRRAEHEETDVLV